MWPSILLLLHSLLLLTPQLGVDNFGPLLISFNDSKGTVLNGNIAISIDRVRENAERYKATFNDELLRVMVHGLLHFMGYDDSSDKETLLMRDKEDDNLKTFHVEQ